MSQALDYNSRVCVGWVCSVDVSVNQGLVIVVSAGILGVSVWQNTLELSS